jgi:hypothetical protein
MGYRVSTSRSSSKWGLDPDLDFYTERTKATKAGGTSNPPVRITYDSAGRPVSTTLGNGQASRTIDTPYKANSLVASVTDGTTSFSCDDNRLNRLTSVSQSGTGILPVVSSYAYDPVGALV